MVVRAAPVKWAQRADDVYVTIDVECPKVTALEFTPTSLHFKGTTATGDEYETKIDFYEEITTDNWKQNKSNTRALEFCITKKESKWWPRLLKDKNKVHWLKVDFDKWKDEDESGAEEGLGGNFDMGDYSSLLSGMNGGGAGAFGGPGAGGFPDFNDEDDDEDDGDMPPLEGEDEGAETNNKASSTA